MEQARLSSLTILAVEVELVRQLNFDEIFDNFAVRKSRIIIL